MDDRFLRKAKDRECLPSAVQNAPELCLLRVMFGIPDDHDEETLCRLKINYLGETYAVKELAADMGLSVFSVYKMFSEERPIRFGHALRILDFIHFKNPDDTRLVDFIVGHAGFVAMPKAAGDNIHTLRQIYELTQEITKREG